MDIDAGISYLESMPEPIITELSEALRKSGAKVSLEKRSNLPLMAVDWLFPTAIVLFLSHKFFGTLLQEAAKEAYPVMRDALLKMIARTCGKDKEISLTQVATSPLKSSRDTAPVFTLIAQLRIQRPARFTFDDDLEAEFHIAALENLFTAVRDHYRYYPEDPLTKALEQIEPDGHDEIHMVFDTSERVWNVVNVREEIIRRQEDRKAEIEAREKK